MSVNVAGGVCITDISSCSCVAGDPPICGDGTIDSGEECDGSAPSGYTCISCSLVADPSGGVYCDNDNDGEFSSYSYGSCLLDGIACIESYETSGICLFESPGDDCDDGNILYVYQPKKVLKKDLVLRFSDHNAHKTKKNNAKKCYDNFLTFFEKNNLGTFCQH